jgi:hypothetical protein
MRMKQHVRLATIALAASLLGSTVVNGQTLKPSYLSEILPWYPHTTPSFSVNGWYTLQNTFTTFSRTIKELSI